MTKAEAKVLAKSDLRAVLATAAGRRFIWRTMEQAGLYAGSMRESSESTAYTEGRRSVALGLMRMMQELAPDLYLASAEEHLRASGAILLKGRETAEEAPE